MTTTTTIDLPVAKKQLGPVTVTIWENKTQNGPNYSYQLARIYRDADFNFADSGSFRERDAMNLTDQDGFVSRNKPL